jgi:hypothetical protein
MHLGCLHPATFSLDDIEAVLSLEPSLLERKQLKSLLSSVAQRLGAFYSGGDVSQSLSEAEHVQRTRLLRQRFADVARILMSTASSSLKEEEELFGELPVAAVVDILSFDDLRVTSENDVLVRAVCAVRAVRPVCAMRAVRAVLRAVCAVHGCVVLCILRAVLRHGFMEQAVVWWSRVTDEV